MTYLSFHISIIALMPFVSGQKNLSSMGPYTHQQRKHAKRVLFFDHEDIQLGVRNWFMITKPEKRSIHELATRINTVIIPQALDVPGNISMSVLRNYMHIWRFMYRRHKKDIYLDGHERADIVEYGQGRG